MTIAILALSAAGVTIGILAYLSQLRWRRPLLLVEFNRFGGERPGWIRVTAAVRNDGEGTVYYVQPVALLGGKRYEHEAGGAMPLLGREQRTSTGRFPWTAIPPPPP
jgi:hypothetical protein